MLLLLWPFRLMPPGLGRAAGAALASLLRPLLRRLEDVGRRNLELAYPDASHEWRTRQLRLTYRNLGWHFAGFCRMPRLSRGDAERMMRYEGLANYTAAVERGKGVLVLTGHLGAWELSSYFHSLMGYPMGMVIRRLDNPLVDRLVNGIRCAHGNRVLHKDDFARELLRAMAAGETVGILMDTNMTPPQGVFVPFFGVEACTASGLARVAAKTGAAVLPGFLLWHEDEQRYVLHFGEALTLNRSGDSEADARSNTALFAAVTERYIRKFPDQWLWLHRRWKTRPAGEPPIY